MRLIDADSIQIPHFTLATDRIKMIDAIDEAPTIEPKAKVVAQVTFDEEKMREIVKEAVERFKEEYEIEPKRGENLKSDYPSLFECSVCGASCDDTIPWDCDINFCPNCGCAMTKESE